MFCVLAAAFMLVCQAFAAGAERPRFRPDRVILLPKGGAPDENLTQLHAKSGRRMLRRYGWMGGLQVVQLAPGEKVGEAILRYRSSGLVEFAEPDYKLHSLATPNDPEFKRGTQWSFYNSGAAGGKAGSDIQAVLGWDTLSSASNIVVAIIDSGIRYTHEDLAENMWVNAGEIPENGIDDDRNGYVDDVHGMDSIAESGDPMDDVGHGTHVAGIIGAVGNNGVGVAGVAWRVKLMACRFLSKAGDGDTSDAIQCIDYARRMGARVMNASWGGPDYSAALFSAINSARGAGIVFVAASGNDAQNIDEVPLYPASYTLDNIIVVGGTTRSDTMDSGYSNWGANSVDLFAPGTGIYSTWHTWDGAYTSNTGTSMAAPHVTGIAALMRARFPTYTAQQIVNRLRSTVDAIPELEGKCRTGGRVNMARALGPNPAAGFDASRLAGEPPLSVTFTNTSFGEVASHRWDFGDGSAVETNESPTHVFEYGGWFQVRLEITGRNGKSNTFEQVIKVAPNYEASSNLFAWIDPASMPALVLTDNGFSAAQALPFPFRFYGETQREIFVGANGLLSFSTNGLSTTDNTTLPSGGAPNGLICPYWDNLNPPAGGSIHAGIVGEAPNRKFVATWASIQRNSSAVDLTFQAVLEEGSNDIVFQYADVQPEAARGGGKRATVGLENADGTVAALYSYNGAPVVLENQSAVRFSERPFRYLAVSAPANTGFFGVKGHEFARTNLSLGLANPGNREVAWGIEGAPNWAALSQTNGTLAPGGTTEVAVTLAPGARELATGVFEGKLVVTNLTDGKGTRTIPLSLEVAAPVTRLAGEAIGADSFTGGLGGPFAPDSISIAVRNTGNIPAGWNAAVTENWLEVLFLEEVLEPGQTSVVEVLLTDQAALMPSGRHLGKVVLTTDDPAAAPVEVSVHLQVNARIVQQSASIANGMFEGVFTIPQSGSFSIEASEDLVNWMVSGASVRIDGGTARFSDPLGEGGRRFYRLVVIE